MAGRPPKVVSASDLLIQKLKIVDELMPAIEMMVQKEISLEEFNSEVAPIAAMRLASLMLSADEAIALKACQEVLHQEKGKPMQRQQVLTADVSLNAKQIDKQILQFLEKPKQPEPVKPAQAPRPPKVADLSNGSN